MPSPSFLAVYPGGMRPAIDGRGGMYPFRVERTTKEFDHLSTNTRV